MSKRTSIVGGKEQTGQQRQDQMDLILEGYQDNLLELETPVQKLGVTPEESQAEMAGLPDYTDEGPEGMDSPPTEYSQEDLDSLFSMAVDQDQTSEPLEDVQMGEEVFEETAELNLAKEPPENATPEELLDFEQRQMERVPTVFEKTGLATNFSNMSEVFPPKFVDRARGFYVGASKNTSNVNLSIPAAVNANWDQPMTAERIQELQGSTPEKIKPQVFKSGNGPELSAAAVMFDPKILGIAKLNPAFDPENATYKEYVEAPKAVTKEEKAARKAAYQALPTNMPAMMDPAYGLVMMSVVEPWLYERSMYTTDDGEVLSPEAMADVQDLEGTKPGDPAFDMTVQGIGKEFFKAARRVRSQFAGEETDTYMEDYNNLTPEAFEMIGQIVLSTYQQNQPNIVTFTPGGIEPNGTPFPPKIVLSTEGYAILQSEANLYKPMNMKLLPMLQQSMTGSYQNESSLVRTSSGSIPNPKSTLVDDAKVFYHNVPNFLDNQRTSLLLMFGSHAMATDPKSKGGTSNFTHNAFDMGPERIKKIEGIAAKEQAKISMINVKLSELQKSQAVNWTPLKQMRIDELDVKLEVATKQLVKFESPDFLRQQYYMSVNKSLEVLANVATYDGKPFHFTYFNQRATQRLTAHQSTLSPQNNHLMRNIIGSGKKYEIKPGSGSRAEQNFLYTISAILFNGAGLVRERSIQQAIGNIRGNTAPHQRIVRVGKKLREGLVNFNSEAAKTSIGQVTSTPQGIRNADRIVGGLPEVITSDPETMQMLEAISDKVGHKHFIQALDAVMELSKYDESIRTGKAFHSSMNYIEVDGVSNGLATMFAVLGLESQMYRVGAFRAEGSEKILGKFDDIAEFEAYEGNIRKTLENNLTTLIDGQFTSYMLTDAKLMKKYKYSPEDIETVRSLFTEALADNDNFLKKPLMTFAYGQEMDNLIGSIFDTILANPTLEEMSNKFPGGILKTAQLMNEVRGVAVIATLGKEVVEFATTLKDGVDASTMFGKMVQYEAPTGGKTMFGGMETQYKPDVTARSSVVPAGPKGKLEEQLLKARKKANKNLEVGQSPEPTGRSFTVTAKKPVVTPFAEQNGIMGAKARGASLAIFAQSFDGNSMVRLASGEGAKRMEGQWVVPIYDAIVGDLGSGDMAQGYLNSDWFKQTNQTRVLDDLKKSITGNIHFGLKDFKKLAETKDGVIDEQLHGKNADFVINLLKYLDATGPVKKEAMVYVANLMDHRYYAGEIGELNPMRNYRSLYKAMQFAMKYKFGDTVGALDRITTDARKGRYNVARKMADNMTNYPESDNSISQFSPDEFKLGEVFNP